MNSTLEKSISRIHGSKTRLVMAISGVGSQSANWLLAVPGASKTLLEATIPYSNESLNHYIGEIPEQYVSESTALSMAKSAYFRGLKYHNDFSEIVGISCTGAISTNRERRGENQAFIAMWSPTLKYVHHVLINKGVRTRREEEELISSFIIKSIEEKALGASGLKLELTESESSTVVNTEFTSNLDALVNKHIKSIVLKGQKLIALDQGFSGGILSGSFNPIHQGHIGLAKLGPEILNCQTVFEISVTNVDKDPLNSEEVCTRISQFNKNETIFLTSAPLFSEKSEIFKNSTFIIGNDTAGRLVDPKYYKDSIKAMNESLKNIQENKCDFLVAGRLQDKDFRTVLDVDIPENFTSMFRSIPENQFRIDLSSTELRKNETG